LGKVRELFQGFQTSWDIRLIRIKVADVLNEMVRNSITQVCLGLSKQVIEATEADLHNITLYLDS
jgi:hypothetical protein